MSMRRISITVAASLVPSSPSAPAPGPCHLARSRRVIVLTHLPPSREACWHRRRISGGDWPPHFACRAVGEVLGGAMGSTPEREMTVLCAHAHAHADSPGEPEVLPNLRVMTGGAE